MPRASPPHRFGPWEGRGDWGEGNRYGYTRTYGQLPPCGYPLASSGPGPVLLTLILMGMSRADLPASADMGAVAPGTLPVWQVCGVPGRPWSWRRVCLVLWPGFIMLLIPHGRNLPMIDQAAEIGEWRIAAATATSHGQIYPRTEPNGVSRLGKLKIPPQPRGLGSVGVQLRRPPNLSMVKFGSTAPVRMGARWHPAAPGQSSSSSPSTSASGPWYRLTPDAACS